MSTNLPDIIKAEELEVLNSQVAFMAAKDGRKIAYYQYGAKDGAPILFCHGTGSHIPVSYTHLTLPTILRV